MNTILLIFSTLLCIACTRTAEVRSKRGYYSGSYMYSPQFDFHQPLRLPLHETNFHSLGIETFLPIPQGDTLSAFKASISPVALTNSVEKPVQEQSDLPPQPSTGTAIIPLQPPPAVPVNAAAANVPANNGAVFLGSGALGVINLGNGAFALGSGGIGYSDQRQQPRSNGLAPLYPPLAATPNLVPAATPSQQPRPIPQINFVSQPRSNGFQFNQPFFSPDVPQQQVVDQNGYERLEPNAAGFGTPVARIRPLKTRNSFATPTVPQVQVEPVHASQLPALGFGEPIARLPPHAVTYD